MSSSKITDLPTEIMAMIIDLAIPSGTDNLQTDPIHAIMMISRKFKIAAKSTASYLRHLSNLTRTMTKYIRIGNIKPVREIFEQYDISVLNIIIMYATAHEPVDVISTLIGFLRSAKGENAYNKNLRDKMLSFAIDGENVDVIKMIYDDNHSEIDTSLIKTLITGKKYNAAKYFLGEMDILEDISIDDVMKIFDTDISTAKLIMDLYQQNQAEKYAARDKVNVRYVDDVDDVNRDDDDDSDADDNIHPININSDDDDYTPNIY